MDKLCTFSFHYPITKRTAKGYMHIGDLMVIATAVHNEDNSVKEVNINQALWAGADVYTLLSAVADVTYDELNEAADAHARFRHEQAQKEINNAVTA